MIEHLLSGFSSILNTVDQSIQSTDACLETVFSRLDKSFEKQKVISEVTYEDIVKWFVNQPRHEGFVRAAVSRSYYGKNRIAIVQVFLDESNQVIDRFEGKQYGRKLICESIDEELSDAFGQRNVIVFE